MKKITFIVFITLGLSLCLFSFSEAKQIVVANKDVPVTSIGADEIKNIYLGKKSQWENGMKIVPVTLDSGSTHDDFMANIVKKSASQFSTYWKQMIFTGQGTPPKSFSSEAEVVKYVSDTAGAIGYIDSATAHDTVKEVQVK